VQSSASGLVHGKMALKQQNSWFDQEDHGGITSKIQQRYVFFLDKGDAISGCQHWWIMGSITIVNVCSWDMWGI
jgi:hypothetical protein